MREENTKLSEDLKMWKENEEKLNKEKQGTATLNVIFFSQFSHAYIHIAHLS